jgi:hypothetical protein
MAFDSGGLGDPRGDRYGIVDGLARVARPIGRGLTARMAGSLARLDGMLRLASERGSERVCRLGSMPVRVCLQTTHGTHNCAAHAIERGQASALPTT